MYTSWCGTLLVDMSVPSAGSIVSLSLRVQWGSTPLLRAAANGHAKVARFLMGSGSSVTEQDNVGWPKGILPSCDHLMLFPWACTPVIVTATQWKAKQCCQVLWPPLRCFIVACTAIGCTNSVHKVLDEALQMNCHAQSTFFTIVHWAILQKCISIVFQLQMEVQLWVCRGGEVCMLVYTKIQTYVYVHVWKNVEKLDSKWQIAY